MTFPVVMRASASLDCLRKATRTGPARARPRPRCVSSRARSGPSSLSLFSDVEEAILSAATRHIPVRGFTSAALVDGARDAGYLEASSGFFSRGPFELVLYHLILQRQALWSAPRTLSENSSTKSRLRDMLRRRLLANQNIIRHWHEAIALAAQPGNAVAMAQELFSLSDELWHLSGDDSVDITWYTKRAGISAIYASTELFMITDYTPNFEETINFLDRRLEDCNSIRDGARGLGQWYTFTGASTLNVLRSKGLKI